MKYYLFFLSLSIGLFLSCNSSPESNGTPKDNSPKELTLLTSDSLTIVSDLYVTDQNNPSILLCHQGGSNARAEYYSIIPKLLDEGFNVLALDQRVGGQWYGSYNRTVKDINHMDYGYCDAYPDLEKGLNYLVARGFSGNIIVWGSSYSASLAIQLAAKNPDKIDGILAFSPASGPQLEGCIPNDYFKDLKSPMLLLRPPNEMQYESVQKQMKLADSLGHKTYKAKNGVHGSSMLVAERVKGDVSENWNTVMAFLNNFK